MFELGHPPLPLASFGWLAASLTPAHVSRTHWLAREKEMDKRNKNKKRKREEKERKRHVTYATNSLVPWEL